MKRRAFLALLGSAGFASGALGQERGRVYRLGILSPITQAFDTFRAIALPELANHGFVEGGNLSVRYRSGTEPDLPGLAQELLDHSPDAILAIAVSAARVIRKSTSTIPIVLYGGEDAISEGLAGTLSHPGGNVTGVVILATSLNGKRIQLLHEVIPTMRRVAVLLFSRSPVLDEQQREVQAAAAGAGLDVAIALASGRDDYAAAFRLIRESGAQALVIGANAQFYGDAELLLDHARAAALPTACEWANMAQLGCLLGYGPDRNVLYRTVGRKLALVLQGIPPSSIPIERPAVFELAVNLKTARSLGLEVPPSTLASADKVIE
jgi:putative ABC transport system substrate-binding protein